MDSFGSSGDMHKVLESVFGELTVMGFIGLIIFTTTKADLLSEVRMSSLHDLRLLLVSRM